MSAVQPDATAGLVLAHDSDNDLLNVIADALFGMFANDSERASTGAQRDDIHSGYHNAAIDIRNLIGVKVADAERSSAVKALRNAAKCLNPALPASFADELNRLADQIESGEVTLS